jgi:hypothetical protein
MTTTLDRTIATSGSWWDDLDAAVLECVAARGATSPEEVGRVIGLSPEGASSLLGMLAREERIRITQVVSVPEVRHARRVARCPVNDNTVSLEVREAVPDGRVLDVLSCSEFLPRTEIRCDRVCLSALR